jgi:hypothetical protein
MPVREIHQRSLATSTALSKYYVASMIPPLAVVRVLNRASVSFVLVGLHGLAGWMGEPRATQDVDVLVASRHHKKAVNALVGAFPELETVDLEVVTRLRKRGTEAVLIDVMKPNQQPHREIFKNTTVVTSEGEQYRIPSLEMALVLKFAPMVSPNREVEAKYQDAHDFIRMVKQNQSINSEKLSGLASLIDADGGKDILEMIRRVRSGEKLIL